MFIDPLSDPFLDFLGRVKYLNRRLIFLLSERSDLFIKKVFIVKIYYIGPCENLFMCAYV